MNDERINFKSFDTTKDRVLTTKDDRACVAIGNVREEFVKETIEVWSEICGRQITSDEAHEIIKDTTEFVRLLAKWDRQAASTPEVDE